MIRSPLFAGVVGLVGWAAGCATLVGLDGPYDLAAEDASVTGARDASPALDAMAVPDAGGDGRPPLVAVGGYSIGRTEVTHNQYAAWLATSPRTDGQPAACAWNTSYAPDEACMMQACSGAGCAEHPQVCIDWCDAAAFCRAGGQRLCGKIGGGAEGFGDYATAARSQWFAACSGNGASAFPYGNGYHVAYCNGGDNQQTGCGAGGLCQTAIAGSSPRCTADAADGGKVFDLSGNAWEWTDACALASDGGAREDACRIRGGSFRVPGDVRLRCMGDATLDVATRSTTASDIGFRCCSR